VTRNKMAVSLLLCVSCISAGDQRIVEDQRQIGSLVENVGNTLSSHDDSTVSSYGQDLRILGKDVRLGAETLQQNLVGGPPTPQTYNPGKAEQHRNQSDRAAEQRQELLASTLGFAGRLTGFDYAGIAAIITALGGTVIAIRRSNSARREADVASQEASNANQEADIAVRSTRIALDEISDIQPKSGGQSPRDLVLEDMKRLQEGAGMRDRIRVRLKKY